MKTKLITVLIFSALISNFTQADSSVDEDSVLPDIVVSATRSVQEQILTPASIIIIDSDEIMNSGATTIADLLRSVGTVQVRDLYGDGSRSAVSIRGFGATAGSNTLVLVDGRRLNNSDLGDPDLGSIAIKDIQQIEIILGSAGSLFGDQATGGVINVITHNRSGSGARIKASYGSYDSQNLQAKVHYLDESGLGFTLNANQEKRDGYRDRSQLQRINLFANVSYTYATGSVFLEGQIINEELQLAGALTAAEMSANRKQAQYQTDFADTDTDIFRLGLQQTFMGYWKLIAEVTQRQSDAVGVLSGGTPFTQNRQVRTFNPRIVGQLDNVMVTAGYDLETTDYGLTSDFGGFFATTKSDQDIQSAYLQVIAPLNRDLRTTFGFRRASVNNNIDDTFTYPGGKKFDHDLNVFEIGLRYDINEETSLVIRRDENYRFPKTDELTFMGINIVDLEPQTGVSWELGVDWHKDNWEINSLYYRLTLENELGFDPIEDIGYGFYGANANLDDTLRQGFTTGIRYSVSESLEINGRFDYIDASFTQGAFNNNQVPYVNKNAFSIGVTVNPMQDLTVFVEGLYNGSRYVDGDFENDLGREPSYTLLNANVSYRKENWGLSLRIDNLTDRQYAEYSALRWDGQKTYYPSPERRFVVEASFGF